MKSTPTDSNLSPMGLWRIPSEFRRSLSDKFLMSDSNGQDLDNISTGLRSDSNIRTLSDGVLQSSNRIYLNSNWGPSELKSLVTLANISVISNLRTTKVQIKITLRRGDFDLPCLMLIACCTNRNLNIRKYQRSSYNYIWLVRKSNSEMIAQSSCCFCGVTWFHVATDNTGYNYIL